LRNPAVVLQKLSEIWECARITRQQPHAKRHQAVGSGIGFDAAGGFGWGGEGDAGGSGEK